MPIAATLLLALAATAGAWLDVASRRLPNWLCLAIAIFGLGFAFAAGGAEALLSATGHAAIALAGGMILFRFGMIGGGDAKFYAACAAWFPLASALSLLGLVSAAGLVLVIVWLGYRQITGARRKDPNSRFAMVPYGVAVAIGAIALKALSG